MNDKLKRLAKNISELLPDNPKFESIKAKLKSGETTIDTVKQYFNISDNTLKLLQ